VIVARKDIGTSYHLSVVVDDAIQGVTHVTRGQDLFHATHVHRLLQVLIGLPEPAYEHHGLVRDDTGRRLSKSARDRSLLSLRAEGATPADIRRLIGMD
jgi:glutamyl-Q tRNA(Asp) synthetase